ncbi:amino acid adenylation domain-containing protein [Schlegelella sp. S2-27]|uniref:Amino acid adenylation domain-containing protein n=1 Tax=Caldimonas mangrovi TaxID=2944811 RepID=A0ABT0YW24_9BURK|nr:non-ribosomal peptide synthetase [Caldimonas mangrovi]MCM5682956.1 amino acid adenylation domain-containing protein [Caldimonas mangrovi]
MNENLRVARGAPRNMVRHLRALAQQRPTDAALIAVSRDTERRFDHAGLDTRARAIAAALQRQCALGERALLLLDNDEHYVSSFLGCLYAGVIAVPVFPPESNREQHLARLRAIAADCDASCVMTTAAIRELIGSRTKTLGGADILAVDEVDLDGASDWREHDPRDSDVAFLQYTSGSTATPKGVMVSHGNLMANERAIEQGLSVGPDDVFVNWLPLYHDMGLIGGLLQPLHRGIPVVLMSPGLFLERPVRWLEAISRHRGTISGGPDFAFRLCLERVKEAQAATLDLSCWRVAFSGAEPVRHDTLQAFIERFAPAGFRADAVYPCYGLAEATLFVTGGQRGAGLKAQDFSAESLAQGQPLEGGETTLVGCGSAPSGHRIEIVEPTTLAVLPAGRVGEIWFSGPSIACGYWGRQEASEQTFFERNGCRWLRTGDLGFLHDGQLYVAGRIKDLIILRGHNVYPQDIERAIEAEVEAVRKGRVAAFAVTTADGREGVGVAVEVSRGLQKLVPPAALVEALSAAAAGACGEGVSVALLLNPGALPKTSSGKLQRGACRQGWLARSLDTYAIYEHGRLVGRDAVDEPPMAPLDDTRQALAMMWREVLQGAAGTPIGPAAHFFGCGGHSLAATQLAARMAERWQVECTARTVFEHPRLDALAREIDRLRAQSATAAVATIPVLLPERRAAPLALSHAQERLWFLWQLDPGNAAYHVSGALRLRGRLDASAMHGAFADLMERHESLRTVYRSRPDGMPEQVVQQAAGLSFESVDLRALDESAREDRVRQHAGQLHAEPFDLGRGPLLRVALVQLADEEHVLIVGMHHIASDGASMQVLVEDLARCYAARVEGRSPGLTRLPIQYADYAVWQRGWLEAGERERQLAYWRERLGEDHPVLALPADHPRRPTPRHRAGRYETHLPSGLCRALREYAASQDGTPFMVMLAALQALLYRYTGQQDVRIGVPVANRGRIETEGLIGFFVNTLVLRNVIHGRTSLSTVLSQARAALLGAQAHQDLPFEQLVEALQPQRSLTHTPLFQVAFNHLAEGHDALREMAGIEVERYPVDEEAVPFELTLDSRELAQGGICVAWRYAADLFEPQTIEQLARHYVCLLQAMIDRPELAVADVEMLGERDRQALLERGGTGAEPTSDGPCLHHRFEACAARDPQRIAVSFEGRQLSYRELDQRANLLARRLTSLGIRPEDKVGVALDRSERLIVALLGVLKAGAAYVPLDPAYPDERLRFMADDAGIRVLITQADLRARFLGVSTVLELDTMDFDATPADTVRVPMRADQLAYVIYTSGSTGQPKGAQLTHGHVTRLLESTRAWFGFDAQDVWTLFHSYAFDFSVWEIFGALCHGARLVVVPHAVTRAPDRMLQLLRDEGVTVLNQTPSAFRQLAQAPGLDSGGLSLRLVVFGGEALDPQSLAPWVDRFGDERPRLVNMYGITETTVHVTYRPLTRADLGPVQRSPIGRPIPDLALRVLDAELNLMPAGVPGELYVAGAGLARGYLNRPALTAQRFVADPFGPPGARLYRTGDLVRQRIDGEIEYLGRVDHQLKIRGFRIELGEIEAVLLSQPDVREALAVAVQGPEGVALAAYVAAAGAARPDGIALREALGRVLPDYMVPASITVLDAFPLTTNGKIDCKALPAPELMRRAAYTAPQSDIEQTVAAAWAEALGVDRVGRHDNFFEIGGHSLLLMKVHRLIEQRLPVAVSIVDLFKYPTVESLAAHLRAPPQDGVATRSSEERGRRQRAAFLGPRAASERSPT